MARRGFLAELQQQGRVAARERERAERAAVREHNAAVRRAEQARKADERARAQMARASEAERKRLEKEARDAHVASMEAQVDELNASLAETYDEIDTLLLATLVVDDYVDLESLRRSVQHPPFDRADLETPVREPAPIPDLPEPQLALPEAPGGLSGIFSKKKHAAAVAEAEAAHAEARAEWQRQMAELPSRRQAADRAYELAEQKRRDALASEQARYAEECAQREAEVGEQNHQLDELISNLGYGAVDAVQEYVSIVLSNSAYPEQVPVTHEFSFDPSSAELALQVRVPGPERISKVKAYKYTKSSDEITSTDLSQKACKDRYSAAVEQVALRSLHEIFEADRRGLIKTITIEVGAEAVDPATGRAKYVPFVAAAAERDLFMSFDLSSVLPAATLERLGASVSKNPFGLVAADTAGVRRQ